MSLTSILERAYGASPSPTDVWGVPGMRYDGVFVAPWEITISAPEQVSLNREFRVTAEVKHPCLSRFGSSAFPVFDATDPEAVLTAGNGLYVVAGPDQTGLDISRAGETIALTWTLKGAGASGETYFTMFAGGLVGGSLDIWKDYLAYDYQDLIGMTASWSLTISQ